MDDLNILNATLSAMSRAVAKLSGVYPTASNNPSQEADVNATAHSQQNVDSGLPLTHKQQQQGSDANSTVPQQQQQQQHIGPHSSLPEQRQQHQLQNDMSTSCSLQIAAGLQPLHTSHAGVSTGIDIARQLQSAGVDFLLVDGNKIPSGLPSGVGSRFVIKGDSQCYCIAAASIIAKVRLAGISNGKANISVCSQHTAPVAFLECAYCHNVVSGVQCLRTLTWHTLAPQLEHFYRRAAEDIAQ